MEKRLRLHICEQDLSTFTKHTVKGALFHIMHLRAHEISRLKFQGEICKNGKSVYVNEPITPGDDLEIVFPPDEPVDAPIAASTLPIQWIRYEDEDMLIVYKPPHIPVHPSHGHLTDSLGTMIQVYLQQKHENCRIRMIGRLDKEVSGLVLFAKNQPAAARLWLQRKQGLFCKTYDALAQGQFKKNSGIISLPLGKQEKERIFTVKADGAFACTHYCVVRQLHTFAHVQMRIETGRTHQIRAHMKAIGHPLLGDTLYGSKSSFKRIALQCTSLRCLSPFTSVRLKVSIPLDRPLADLIAAAEKEILLPEF